MASPPTTVTSTATTVETVSGYVGTYYAACAAPTNIVGSVNSDGIDNAEVYGNAINTQDTNAYDSCVSYIKIPGCEIAAFSPASRLGLNALL